MLFSPCEKVVLEVVQEEILEVPLGSDRRYGNGLKSQKKCLPTSVPFTEGGTGDLSYSVPTKAIATCDCHPLEDKYQR